jgi:hypothetical protein
MPLRRATEAIHGEALSNEQAAEHLAGMLTTSAFARTDDSFRIAIAGAQEKTALLRYEESSPRRTRPKEVQSPASSPLIFLALHSLRSDSGVRRNDESVLNQRLFKN